MITRSTVAALVLSLAAVVTGMDEPAMDTITVFDLTAYASGDLSDPRRCREIWDTCHLVASLQGLANRNGPRLFVRYLPPDDYWWGRLFPADPTKAPSAALSGWLAGRQVQQTASLAELLRRFQAVYRGVVVYDERVPATSNLASTIAGVEDLLCLRYDPAPGSLYDQLTNHEPAIPVLQRLFAEDGGPLFTGRGQIPGLDRSSTGSAKGDAYLWAKARYLDPGQSSSTTMAYALDAWWLRQPTAVGPVNHTLSNHDFFIARRAFFFDLGVWDDEVPVDDPGQAPGTDVRVLAEVLRSAWQRNHGAAFLHVGGFIPWAIKYTNHGVAGGTHDPVPTEWRYAEILSCHNAYMDADALGYSAMANASFFQHLPLADRYPQPERSTVTALRQRGHLEESGAVKPRRYVAFYVGDYDAAAWLYHAIPSLWDNPDRGRVPLTWAFNPTLQERMAPGLVYCRDTATANDSFMAGDSGAGYLNPGHLDEPRRFSGLPSGVEAWRRHCTAYYQRWDLEVTGFVIDGYAPAMSEAGFDAYAQFSPGGIIGQKVPQQALHGQMPILRMASDLGDDEEGAAAIIASRLRGRAPQFLAFRSILKSPTWHLRVVEALHARLPDEPVEVVDAITLLALARQHEQSKVALPIPANWPVGEVSYAPGLPERGLYPVAVGDGLFEVTAIAGVTALRTPPAEQPHYLYADVDERFLHNRRSAVEITVEFLDQGSGDLLLEVDAADLAAPHSGAYKQYPAIVLTGSGAWRSHTWTVPDARFGGNQNNGADFRLVLPAAAEVVVRRLTVRRLER